MSLSNLSDINRSITIAGSPEGYDAMLLADICAETFNNHKKALMHIARDDARLTTLASAVRFFMPELEVITFSAWDCLPYDRVSPHNDILSSRMSALSQLINWRGKKPLLLLTTVNAAAQRVPPVSAIKGSSLRAEVGDEIDMTSITEFLVNSGYSRSSQAMEHGEFAVRGGLIDIFPSGEDHPIRLDFFGDELDTIRTYDPLSQRTIGSIKQLHLMPVNEFSLSDEHIRRFRREYVNTFGPTTTDADPLYAAISEGRKHHGAEHWLPLFHNKLNTLFDYLDAPNLSLDYQLDEALGDRLDAIEDYYNARKEAYDIHKTSKNRSSAAYKPLPVDKLYLIQDEWDAILSKLNPKRLSPFQEPESNKVIVMQGRQGRDFAPERNSKDINIYDSLKEHVDALRELKKRVVFACYSLGAATRLEGVLKDHGVRPIGLADSWADIRTSNKKLVAVTVVPLEHGFESEDLAVITEQDVLGDRMVRKTRRSKKADNFLTEASSLTAGDYVVHASHGIGIFDGLENITVSGASHDCLRLTYSNGDKLFVPVENIEILSRYGSAESGGQLDKLGGVAWQARKAKMKKRIRDMADDLIKLAAERALREGQRITSPEGLYEEFCAKFPFTETEDQLRSIGDVISDLSSGRPMDRLICGDVGFGKTEVGLRATFLAAMGGHQVVIVAPTTLLARQHFITFTERFKGLPLRIAQLSRLVSAKDAKASKEELRNGTLDIVIGTHALLAKDISVKNLGLLIIDEEQHFGVAHKERLKQLKANVHVLTLTATPIPRTLQMAMTGLRDLSIIATPPVDRLAVRTFVLPFDQIVVREALLREHFRGGQSFYVCPRIADLDQAATFLKENVPEVKFVMAHGQMTPSQIEDVMNAFYEGRYDVLLSTTIVESGIDVPTANTMIIHRADMFGLSQLYQLRGRVGRSKTRAYAYLTVPPNRVITDGAEKRLQVLQTLDTLGAGFTIASHDMDIRGAGNLLGDEQSGHVREVGAELYQKMLEEAVADARKGESEWEDSDSQWSPVINLGATVMIPEKYVPDLTQRMALYRRLADLETREDVDAFCAELIDRFGPLPSEVKQLAAIMIIKGYCKIAGIEKLEAGAKGVVITFRDNTFANPAGLIMFITSTGKTAKVRPDHKLSLYARMEKISTRLNTVAKWVRKLAAIAVE